MELAQKMQFMKPEEIRILLLKIKVVKVQFSKLVCI